MPDRQLEYCVRARKKHGNKPIVSCVIYLRDMGKVHEPPHCWELRNGRKLLAFDYLCLKLYEADAEKLLALRQPAMLPLTLLTKGGASCTIIAGIFDELVNNGLRNLLPVTNVLASLAFMGNPDNLAWLERKFREIMSILQDTPAYHWMTDEALHKGRAEGRELGREEGRVEASQEMLAVFIEGRFPQLSKLARKQLALIKHITLLQDLVGKVTQAQTPDEMKRALSDALEESLLLD